ncbi:MAG TPA: hypothetical protein DCE43_25245 [Planctomycetaceae bacterium]|nr:hypothetical protein [Planctomycetaceae bacterium]
MLPNNVRSARVNCSNPTTRPPLRNNGWTTLNPSNDVAAVVSLPANCQVNVFAKSTMIWPAVANRRRICTELPLVRVLLSPPKFWFPRCANPVSFPP